MRFDNLTSRQMLEHIDENFFDLVPTKRKLMSFARILTEKFCKENNVPDVAIQTLPMKYYNMYYLSQRKIVYISDFYTKEYDKFVENKNCYFLKSFFDSLVHELRHHVQYHSVELAPLLKNFALLNYFDDGFEVMSSIPYMTRPHEIDARYFTFKMLKDIEFFSPYYKMKAYIYDEREVDFDSYHLVEVLKEGDLNDIKYLTKPKRALEACVKQIAIKNGLRFVKTEDLENDYKLNRAIGRELAPEFYTRKFLRQRNPRELEQKLNDQRDQFIDIWQEFEDIKVDEINNLM